jgi:hypothetical protein
MHNRVFGAGLLALAVIEIRAGYALQGAYLYVKITSLGQGPFLHNVSE